MTYDKEYITRSCFIIIIFWFWHAHEQLIFSYARRIGREMYSTIKHSSLQYGVLIAGRVYNIPLLTCTSVNERKKTTFLLCLWQNARLMNWTILPNQLTMLMVTHDTSILVCHRHNHIHHKSPPKSQLSHVCTGSFRCSNYSRNHPTPCIPERDIFASSRNDRGIFVNHDKERIQPASLLRI